ncbi:MFS transporter [Streptomyces pluripotens]|uniref:MFS transporter n=1 Tax=Streptomyces pluripotens TaxID=1355015 RepID=A0A221P4Z0_9ACTN|nr:MULTISPECIES: MFS transporter [Streptomyces]ARP73036.1 MFS transporter [Streptomyces pluripotens]ASN27287.1 MFS transporter [Streptomyces pluripotens]KIE28725.1 integral membrane protein LmrP [Streptomyces sp. MUSC 125]MCH0557947.1 MFS transporter [Streptomyces sp. MUM 16J]
MKFRDLHPNIRLRIGVGFVQRCFDIMLVPLMVIHFSGLYGAATAGVMTLFAALATIACNLTGGHLSDTYGRRPVLLIGELGAFLSYAGLALVLSPLVGGNGIALYVLYLCAGCCAGIALPASETMIVDVSTPATRPAVYTINYWSVNLAFMIGSLIGGFLYGGYFFQLLLAAAVGTGGILLVTWFGISETAPAGTVENPRGIRTALVGYVQVCRDRVFLRLACAALLIRSIEVQISSSIAVRLGHDFTPQVLLHIGSWQLTVDGVNMLGIMRAINTLLVVCCALWVGKLLGGMDERRRLISGIVVFTTGYLVWTVSGNAWTLIAATFVVTAGELMNAPVKQTLLANLVPEESRTKYMAAYGLQVRLGLLVGSLCVTLSAVASVWVMAGLFALFGVAAVVLYRSLFDLVAARSAAERQKAAVAT